MEVRDILYKEITNHVLLVNADMVDAKNRLYSILSKYNVIKIETDPYIYDLKTNIDKYIRDKIIQNSSPRTISSYKLSLNKFSKIIQKKLQDIIKEDILNYFDFIKENNPTVKTTTLETLRYILQGFFSWAKDNQLIDVSPMSKIKPFKIEKRVGNILSVSELEIIRDSCKDIRNRAIIEVAYSTAARLSELTAINIKDIDWQNERLKVIGKGRVERYVFLSERALIHLKRYLDSRSDDCEALFVTEKGEPKRLGNRTIQKIVRELGDSCHLSKRISPHVFRRTQISNLATRECPIVVIKEIVGHSDINTTQRYISITPEFKQQSFKKYQYQ